MIGRNIGTLFSYNAFIKFEENKILKSEILLQIICLINLLATILVIFTKEENLHKNSNTIIESYKNLKIFVTNKKLLFMIFIELFWHFGYNSVESNI